MTFTQISASFSLQKHLSNIFTYVCIKHVSNINTPAQITLKGPHVICILKFDT